jgi:hypothetical protein
MRLSASGSEAQHRRIAFTGRDDLAVTYETGHVDADFDRAGSLPEAEKKLFSRERGYQWQEATLRLRTGKLGLLDATQYRARGEEDEHERTRRRLQWSMVPSRSSKLLLARDESTQQETGRGERESITHLMQWDQPLGNGMALRAVRETTDFEGGEQARTRTRHLLGLQSRAKAPLQWSVERETIDDPQGDAGGLKFSLGGTFFRNWKLQGNYLHATKAQAPGQTNYQVSLTGTPARGWELGLSAVQRALGGGDAANRNTLSLTGKQGVLPGLFQ